MYNLCREEDIMPIEESKASVGREIDECWHSGNLTIVDEIHAANFVNHSPFLGMAPDRKGIKEFMKSMRIAFPDINLTIEDLIAENDQAVERATITGTNKGEAMGIGSYRETDNVSCYHHKPFY
jgi:predicted ester cyclase